MIVDFAIVSTASAVALLVVHTVTFGIRHRIGRYNVVHAQQRTSFFIPGPPRSART